VILRYYRERKNPKYVIPILKDHYLAANIEKRAKTKLVKSLSSRELFLKELKELSNRFTTR
jgi:hypothetical protein